MSSLATRIMIRGLREKTDEKEEELAKLVGQVEALQATKGSGGLGNLADEWDAGALYNSKVKRENVVEFGGNVTAAKGAFSHPLSNGSNPASRSGSVASAVSRVNSRAASERSTNARSGALSGTLSKKSSGPVDVIREEVFRPPEWAKNEQVKFIVKENARAHTQEVDLHQVVGNLSSTRAREVRENAVAPTGNVKNILEKWGKHADEDARRMREQQEREMEAERKRKELAEAQERAEAEQKALIAAEAKAKAEEEARLLKEAEEEEARAKAEAEAAALAEAMAKRKVALPGISPIEPSDEKELIEYLERKNMILDKCIFSCNERIKVLKAM